MKNSIYTLFTRVNSRLLKLAIFVFLPVLSYSQTFVGDASDPTDNAGQAGPITASPTVAAVVGDLVVMYAQYNGVGPTITISQASGQTWNLATTQSGSGQTTAIFWCQFNGTWGADPAVTVGAGNTNALTNALYVFRPTSNASNMRWVVHNTAANSTSNASPNVITGVATTVPNTVTMAFWAGAAANTHLTLAGTGWVRTGLQTQIRNTTGTDQSQSVAYRLLTTTSAAQNVSVTQSVAGTNLLRTIITWAEQPINDICTNAIPLTSAFTCATVTGSVTNANYIAGGGVPGCGAANGDVWYSFTAKTTNPTITTTLTSGTGLRRTELYEGPCGALINSQCSGASNTLAATGLTVGQTYYVRVYSNDANPFAYTICVTDPAPTNDACTSPIAITQSTTCSYTSGNFFGATVAANPPLTPCTGPATFDLWYSFVAQDYNATVDLANVGSAITGAGIQLLNNVCTASGINYGCGTEATSITTGNLTIGTTYYIRVYGTGTAPLNVLNAGFDVCVTYPPPPPPPNDNCSGVITLQNNQGCSNLWFSFANATPSVGYTITGTACAPAPNNDMWFKFTATIANPVITLGGAANNFTNRGLQLLSGTCGTTPTFTSIACGTTSISATGLTIGNTYYIRVFSSAAGAAPTGNANFQLCVASSGQPLKFGNSYVNITKKTTGGVVEPGDILEIRMTVAHTTGTMYNMRYMDNLPTNTVYDSASPITIITNEGVVVPTKSYTWNGGDDAAMFTGTPGAGEYNIRMNLGFGASVPGTVSNTGTSNVGATGQMIAATDIPKGTTNSMLFATAFRVKVTGAVGSTITLGAGQFRYATTNGGADNILNGTPYQILISTPMSLCTNATGVNMSTETGGTFGTGTTLNRSYDLATPIPSYTFINTSSLQGLGDGQYSIVKNTSPRGGIDPNADRVGSCVAVLPSQQACGQRMHSGHWEIDGDHTGSLSMTGNAPTANGTNAGYMLMVNADYVASEVYRQDIGGLCPNTYYEFSAWFRNICSTCGNDYTTGSNYAVRQPGVLPNLTFALDGFDRYNTGEIPFAVSGPTNGWVKKGFVFVTGPTQTSATFSIRNNSQGGGGNDWVMDDISVATCLPNMSYSPSLNPTVCLGNAITLNDTITSYFNNYVHYKWQRSATGGGAWTDIPGQTGTASATPVTGGYRYITSYSVPLADAQLANNGDRYRVIVATTSANLGSASCNVTDGVSIIDVQVIDCTPILKTDLITFSGRLADNIGLLSWTTKNEEANMKYVVERSTDGRQFHFAGTVTGIGNRGNANHYSFTDPVAITDKVWYRLQMITQDNQKKYSSVILLASNLPDFDFVKVVNPFSNSLEFDLAVSSNAMIDISLVDMSGKLVRSAKQMVYSGTNNLKISNTESLPAGVYTLRLMRNEKIITRRVVKTN